MYSITLLILLLIKMLVCDNSSVKSCTLARDICATKIQCSQAFHDFNSSCKSEIRGITSQYCSMNCQSAIVTLSVIKEGNQFLNCKCDNDEEHDNCVLLHKRIGICLADKHTLNNVIISSNNTSDFDKNDESNNCYNSLLYCKSDVLCYDQYQIFRYLCKNALKGEFCNQKCRRSVTTLEKQISGFSVQRCKCDDNYCNVCEFEKHNIINACFSKTTVHNSNNYAEPDICDQRNHPKLIAKLEDNNYLTTDTSNNYDLLEFEILLLILCLIMSFI